MGSAVLTTSDAAWAWPANVTELTAEALGGGGAGGNATNNPSNCGGGKGGSYAKVVITKGVESTLNITVGGPALASTIVQNGTTVLSAPGGATVAANSATGATALVGSHIGTEQRVGGNGGDATGTNTVSGGGGGAAGPGADGGAAAAVTAGTPNTSNWNDGNPYGGTSGAGVAVRNVGVAGTVRGGAGSGGNSNQAADKIGGAGAAGVVVLTWTDAVTGTFAKTLAACILAAVSTVSIAAVEIFNATESDWVRIAYKVAGVSEPSTVTFTQSADSAVLSIAEWSGLTNAIHDATASTGRTIDATSLSSGTTGTTTAEDELAVAMVGIRSAISVGSFTNGFTTREEEAHVGSVSTSILVGDKVLSATGTQETTGSWTTAGVSMAAIATFRADTAITGALAKTLGGCLLAADATVSISGSATLTLGSLTTSGSGVLPVVGTSAPTLGALTSAASGTVADPVITGDLTVTLEALSGVAVGSVHVTGRSEERRVGKE